MWTCYRDTLVRMEAFHNYHFLVVLIKEELLNLKNEKIAPVLPITSSVRDLPSTDYTVWSI